MSYRDAVGNSKPNLPLSGTNGEGAQVLGHWGPHRESSISEVIGGNTVVTTTRNDTTMVALLNAADGNTYIMASATSPVPLQPGSIYELTIAGSTLGYPYYFAMEWTNLDGSNAPAPAAGDFSWPAGNIPQFVFVAKEGQERLSLKLILNSVSVTTAFGDATASKSYIQLRKLT